MAADERPVGRGARFTPFELRGRRVRMGNFDAFGAESDRACTNVPPYLSSRGCGPPLDTGSPADHHRPRRPVLPGHPGQMGRPGTAHRPHRRRRRHRRHRRPRRRHPARHRGRPGLRHRCRERARARTHPSRARGTAPLKAADPCPGRSRAGSTPHTRSMT
ncbi:hypothetical protein [Thermobifida cellulosilytica]|uniref:hypothetical protein n=1 Tax=Thermobifida cellulosilytica TaxID=144786 RepID=UPI002FC2EA26